MNKIMIIIFCFMMVACSNQKTFELPLDEYPQTFLQEVSKLPKEYQEKMKVPTEFPFEVEFLNFSKDEVKEQVILTAVDFEPVDAELSDKINIHLTTSYAEGLDKTKSNQTTVLDGGVQAYIKKDEDDVKIIEWTDNDNVTHTLAMKSKGEKITISQLVIMANSMKEISLIS
ncbi:hypothetical protein JOC86_002215 [Bacillus pakistanensis]|uniref:DUF4367 domain-containing protein n=1 Tax=Rossellomorea pakistanensis TaxID=992288 RepID=A0ABS2NCV0_9BACI|nr:hypothetical protein [Bacillus pakistanensis]MBM7585673.1 hypothetical protein [Bacillus pakistanensis]